MWKNVIKVVGLSLGMLVGAYITNMCSKTAIEDVNTMKADIQTKLKKPETVETKEEA